MNALFDPTVSLQLVLTLGHFLWQGLVVGGTAWLAARGLSRAAPALRYRVYLAALLVMTACPIVTFSWLRGTVESAISDRSPTAPMETALVAHESPERVAANRSERPLPLAFAPKESAATADETAQRLAAGSSSGDTRSLLRSFAQWLTAAYFAGALAMFVRLALGLRGGRRLRRRSESVTDPELLDLLARRATALGSHSPGACLVP